MMKIKNEVDAIRIEIKNKKAILLSNYNTIGEIDINFYFSENKSYNNIVLMYNEIETFLKLIKKKNYQLTIRKNGCGTLKHVGIDVQELILFSGKEEYLIKYTFTKENDDFYNKVNAFVL